MALVYYRLGPNPSSLIRILRCALVANVLLPFIWFGVVLVWLFMHPGIGQVQRNCYIAALISCMPSHVIMVRDIRGIMARSTHAIQSRRDSEHCFAEKGHRTSLAPVKQETSQDCATQTDTFQYHGLSGPYCSHRQELAVDERSVAALSNGLRAFVAV